MGAKFIQNLGDLDEYIAKNYKESDFAARLAKIFKETKIGVMLSHYYWMIWAVKMCKTPDSDFDYLEFAYQKLGWYNQMKEVVKAL
mmetsp:Transcript_59094/g.81998  ORF Transcript_59094/g.81998 Transcript_59094/m.81998 type:complete len:86 (+) Transcript_59094:88-345(+)